MQRLLRALLAAITAIAVLLPPAIVPAQAASGDRTLYLYYTHTKETGKITFRRGGRYDQKGLAELNRFLRDWRRNEPTKMDPALFDLIWEVYQESGATGPIHVVSAYRSPKTNEMLRSKSRAVAKNSRHTMGMAMDFFIPGVKVSKLRQIAMRKQVGGVGYYPTSGNPFVHLDTGNVRAWPRMTHAQLQRVFPDGKTLHVPNTGVPLSQKGYQLAKAEWVKCHAVPCNGRRTTGATIRVASGNSNASNTESGKPKSTLLGWIFGNDESEGAEESNILVASRGPAQRGVTSVPVIAPIPMDRPGFATMLVADAPLPAPRPKLLAPGHLSSDTLPKPRTLLTSPIDGAVNPLLTAYAPTLVPEPNAQRAVQMLIEQRTRKMSPSERALAELPELEPATFEIASDNIRTASVGSNDTINALGNLFESTWTAVSTAGVSTAQPQLEPALLNVAQRKFDLIAPDLEHITEIFVDPQPMSGTRYAVIFEHDQADFDPATELGRHGRKLTFGADPSRGLDANRFKTQTPLLVASR